MARETSVVDRVSRWIAVVSSVWFGFAAAWGMFQIPGGGHIGAGGSGEAMAAEQILKWRILYPAWGWYSGVEPAKTEYLCHHPFGQYYVPAFFLWIFGHRDFVVFLPAVLMSCAIPPLLYGIAKERWGPPIGAVAAAAYVVVPIAVGFSDYTNLETFVIFGSLLFFWGHTRHLATGHAGYLVASLAGLAYACMGDWVGYLITAPVLGWALIRAFVLPEQWTPPFRYVPYARWWALSVATAGLTIVFTVGLFYKADAIGQWFGAGQMRGGGDTTSLRAVLDARKNWIDFSFTPLAIWLGKLAAPVCLLRLLLVRRDEEVYALSALFGSVVQYVAFKGGADVHIFWPHHFAAYFALAMAQLAASIGWIGGQVARVLAPPRKAFVAGVTGLVAGLLPSVAMAHDGVLSLWVWRRTGGRYDDNGHYIRSNIDQLFVVQEVVMPQTARGMKMDTHGSVGWGWEQLWKFAGASNNADTPQAGRKDVATHPFWIGRASGMGSDEQKRLVGTAHIRVYGDTWIVDQREPNAPLDAFLVREREPNPFEFLVLGGTEPVRSIDPRPDPWLTWEWRTQLGQPVDLPRGEPRSLDELRIAHNVAIEKGDHDGAERWREQFEKQLDRRNDAFTNGVHLIGVRVTHGAQPKVEAWWECTAPIGTDTAFSVRSTMERRGTFSLIPPDTTDREMAVGPTFPTKAWKVGFVYTTEAVLNHRIGWERYDGAWSGGNAPRRVDGAPATVLALLK